MSIRFLPILGAPHFYHRLVLVLLALVTCFLICTNNSNIPMNAAPLAYSDFSNQIVVKFSGEVSRAGIHLISAKNMTDSVIDMAEVVGMNISSAELAVYSQALRDGWEINVCIDANGHAGVTVGLMPVRQRLALGIPLDINEMGQNDFDSVPGIGPELANTILRYRQTVGGVMSANELANVPGIGTKKYLQLKKYFN